MLKKGVKSTTETRKWASATLVWSLNPWISCVWSILSKGPPPLPLPPSLIFMASLPRYQKTYLLCTISLEYIATVKKKPKFPSILKNHWKSSLRPFLHRALQLCLKLEFFWNCWKFIYWNSYIQIIETMKHIFACCSDSTIHWQCSDTLYFVNFF